MFKQILMIFFTLVLLNACASQKELIKVVNDIEDRWKIENDVTLKSLGMKKYRNISYRKVFEAMKTTFESLGITVYSEDITSGLIEGKTQAPNPLSLSEWEEVKEIDTKSYKDICHETLFLVCLLTGLDPEPITILSGGLVREHNDEIIVKLNIKMINRRVMNLSSVENATQQVPPAALKIGLKKYWKNFEANLGSL
jgi:hypothetical protein